MASKFHASKILFLILFFLLMIYLLLPSISFAKISDESALILSVPFILLLFFGSLYLMSRWGTTNFIAVIIISLFAIHFFVKGCNYVREWLR